jgi:putative transposase
MRRRSPEDIVTKLRQAEFFMAQGHAGIEVARALGLMAALYQDQKLPEAARKNAATAPLEELQVENARLRKTVADLILEKRILQELAKGNW